MRYIVVTLLISILLFDVILGGEHKDQARNKRSIDKAENRARRAAGPPGGFIDPSQMGIRLKIRRTYPYRRAPRIKRFRRMAEDAEMFKRGLAGGKHIRVKKTE